jgi:hypothetical protein
MVDLRNDPAFVAAIAATRESIAELASRGVLDAESLVARSGGWHNLQGHAQSLLPLAVAFARAYSQRFQAIRASTNLRPSMGPASREARNRSLWDPVMREMKQLIANRGTDVITEGLARGTPQSIADIANTYLSIDYGGGQTTGGAGNTVIKRTLKILAHIFYE